MKRFYLFCLMLILGLSATVTFAETDSVSSEKSKVQVFIKYQRIDWQTYDFSAQVSDPNVKFEGFQWRIDTEAYFGRTARYVFNPGNHTIQLKAKTETGDFFHDQVDLKIDFWSLNNADLWWLIYGLLALGIIYYWIVKLLYLLSLRLAKKQARSFMSVFDDDPWQAELMDELLEKYLNQQLAKTENKLKNNK